MARIIPFPQPNSEGEPSQAEETRFPGLYGKRLGLSDDQIAALVSGDAQSRKAVFEVRTEINVEAPDSIPVLRQTVALLQAVRKREPMRSTAKGNLPAAVVKELFAGAFADAEPGFVRVNREGDSTVLMRVRLLAQKAGLLTKRRSEFSVTKTAVRALDSGNLGEIYRRLLEAHLRHPHDLDRFDRIPDGGMATRSLPLLLFAAWDDNGPYLYEEDFADLLAAILRGEGVSRADLEHAIALRFFERFGVHFGLFVEGSRFEFPVEMPELVYYPFKRWRRTQLFDQVFRRHVGPPALAVRYPEQAAADIMYDVHDMGGRLDGTEDVYLQALCLRAIERCPEEPDPYVVLARLYERKPERSLQLADAGLAASSGRTPDVPAGASPWLDHSYRDVIRLHFIRAEVLTQLGRTDEAFAEWETLLKIDPEDAIGARHFYFPGLILSDQFNAAEQLLKRYPADPSTPACWNRTLAALVRDDTRTADAELDAALEANPHVPDVLAARALPDVGNYYAPWSYEEAVIYAEQAAPAWRHVSGAREWLRRRMQRRNQDP